MPEKFKPPYIYCLLLKKAMLAGYDPTEAEKELIGEKSEKQNVLC